MPREETVEVRFLHHHRDRVSGADYVPGKRYELPVAKARSLVTDKLAEYPTKKAAAAADAAATAAG